MQIPPLKPPFRHFGNHFGPPKSDFWPFYIFGHFPIEIPIETEKIQNSHFPGSKCSTLTYLCSGSKMQPGTAMCFLNFYTLVFWIPLVTTYRLPPFFDPFRSCWQKRMAVQSYHIIWDTPISLNTLLHFIWRVDQPYIVMDGRRVLVIPQLQVLRPLGAVVTTLEIRFSRLPLSNIFLPSGSCFSATGWQDIPDK